MRPVIRLSAVGGIALALGVVSCRKEGDAKSSAQVVKVAQDTMLLDDLAEANKNTAAAASLDNSLGTVRTNPDGSGALVSNGSPGTTTSRAVPRTTNETQTAIPTPAN